MTNEVETKQEAPVDLYAEVETLRLLIRTLYRLLDARVVSSQWDDFSLESSLDVDREKVELSTGLYGPEGKELRAAVRSLFEK